MKKSLALVLALVFVLGIAGTAFAANPFVDVPAKHWAYGAVSQLVKAGIVDGYDDGTFRGDKTLTRYEMAQVVAKALAKSDKADAANKALIEKLSAEFSAELDNLGVRVTNVEKKVNSLGNIKWGGELRWRYDFAGADIVDATAKTYGVTAAGQKLPQMRARLNWSAPIDGNWAFNGRLEKGMKFGLGSQQLGIARAYVAGQFADANVTMGRTVIKTFNAYTGVDKDGLDGVTVSAGNKVKVDLYRLKKDALKDSSAAANGGWFSLAQVTWDVNKDFAVGAHWFADDNKAYFKTTSYGFKYSGLDNLVFAAEYGKNAAMANDPKAYEIKLDWNKADKAKVGSWGSWIGYRSAEDGFDTADFSTAFRHDDAKQVRMNNIKGIEYGFDYTFVKNTKFEVFYIAGTDKTTGTENKHMAYAQIEMFY